MASSLADDPRDRAFERLYSRHVRDVYRYVLAVLRNPAEAEDVTQTTFLNAYRAIQAGAEPQKPHNWLIAIAHNACRSRVRFAMRRPREVPLDDVVEQLAVPESERPNLRELLNALGELPFKQRAAITLRELEGRSHAEIAETLGVTVPAAEALIARARRTLRAQAASLRGLIFVQLPSSLQDAFESGGAAAGGIGTAAAAKIAAVVVAGAIAGGIGSAGTGDAQSTGRVADAGVAVHATSPVRAAGHALAASRPARRHASPAPHARPVHAASTPAQQAAPGATATTKAASSAPPAAPPQPPTSPSQPSAAAAPPSSPSAPAHTASAAPTKDPVSGAVDTVTTAVSSAVSTVTSAPAQLPPAQLPPAQLPPAQLPPAQLPPPPAQLPPAQLPPAQLPPAQLPPAQLPPLPSPPPTQSPPLPKLP